MKKNMWARASTRVALLAMAGIVLMAMPANAGLLTFTSQATWLAELTNQGLNAPVTEDFESAGADILFGDTAGSPITFNDLKLESNAGPSPELANAVIDFDDAGDGSGYRSNNSGPDGGTVVNMRFLNFTGSDPSPEYVEMTLPVGARAFAFDYNNYDGDSDGTELTVDGAVVGAFTATSGFFGVVEDSGATIALARFTAEEVAGGSTGSTTFNSFDNIQTAIPEPASIALLGMIGIAALSMRRR